MLPASHRPPAFIPAGATHPFIDSFPTSVRDSGFLQRLTPPLLQGALALSRDMASPVTPVLGTRFEPSAYVNLTPDLAKIALEVSRGQTWPPSFRSSALSHHQPVTEHLPPPLLPPPLPRPLILPCLQELGETPGVRAEGLLKLRAKMAKERAKGGTILGLERNRISPSSLLRNPGRPPPPCRLAHSIDAYIYVGCIRCYIPHLARIGRVVTPRPRGV